MADSSVTHCGQLFKRKHFAAKLTLAAQKEKAYSLKSKVIFQTRSFYSVDHTFKKAQRGNGSDSSKGTELQFAKIKFWRQVAVMNVFHRL